MPNPTSVAPSLLLLLLLTQLRPAFCVDELRNRSLRGCALIEFPYVKRGEFGHRSTQGFSGVAIDYLVKLRDEAGFRVELVLWNSTFSAFVEHMRICKPRRASRPGMPVAVAPPREISLIPPALCACDIGVGAFTMTNDRVDKVDFLWPFSNENHRMISRRSDLSEVDNGALSYMFNTFSIPVWALITLAVILYACGTAAFGDITPVNTVRYPQHRPLVRARGARRVRLAGSNDGPLRKRARGVLSVFVSAPGAAGTTSALPSTDGESSYVLRLTPEGYPVGESYDDDADGTETPPSSTPTQKRLPYRFIEWLRPRVQRLCVAVVYTFAMFIGQPCEADSAGARASSIHRISWRLLSLTAGIFLFCLYNASLTVLLFESVVSSRFRTLEDVKECVVAPSSVTFIKGGASQDLWKNAITSRGFCKSDKKVRVLADSIEDGLQLLMDRKADFFYSLEGAVLSVVHRQCDKFAVVGEPFFSTSIGFIVPKKSDIRAPLDRATRTLREQDAFQSARNIAMRKQCEEVSAATITLDRLWFFFAAYFFAAFVLIGYRSYYVVYKEK